MMLTIGVPAAASTISSVTQTRGAGDGFLTPENCCRTVSVVTSEKSLHTFRRDHSLVKTREWEGNPPRRKRGVCQNSFCKAKTSWCCKNCVPRGALKAWCCDHSKHPECMECHKASSGHHSKRIEENVAPVDSSSTGKTGQWLKTRQWDGLKRLKSC